MTTRPIIPSINQAADLYAWRIGFDANSTATLAHHIADTKTAVATAATNSQDDALEGTMTTKMLE